MQFKAIVAFFVAAITLVQAQPIEYSKATQELDTGAANDFIRRDTPRQQCYTRVKDHCGPIKKAKQRSYCFRNGQSVCNNHYPTNPVVEVKAGPVDVKAGGSGGGTDTTQADTTQGQ